MSAAAGRRGGPTSRLIRERIKLGLTALEPTALEPTALEPTALEPTALEPTALEDRPDDQPISRADASRALVALRPMSRPRVSARRGDLVAV